MTLTCAHRGDSSKFCENTIVAIQSAIDAGADIVEIDVRITKDNQVIVLHDSTLERLWGVSDSVSQLDWKFISGLGDSENRIPLLSEVLKLFVNTSTILMIDMEEADPAEPTFDIVLSGPMSLNQIFWCGNLNGMKRIRQLSSEARIWMPWNEIAVPMQSEIDDLKPEYINLHYSFVTKNRVEDFRALGLKTAVWTVDDQATMRWAHAIGVDSVTTNELELLQTTISEKDILLMEEIPHSWSIENIDIDRAMMVARDLGKWATLVIQSMEPGSITTKLNPADIVTQVDVMIEVHVREIIATNFPGHNFFGEELGVIFT